jgi:hypothetical protein
VLHGLGTFYEPRLENHADAAEELQFLYSPTPSEVASFSLHLSFDGRQLKRVELKTEDPEKNCVEASVEAGVDGDQRRLRVDSLYYDIERKLCNFERLGETKAGETPRKGEGAIVLGALVSIAASFRLPTLALTDAALFFDETAAPFWGKIGVTDYLRKVRGYGQYEGYGFFVAGLDEQGCLDYIHTRMTTPLASFEIPPGDTVFDRLVNTLRNRRDYTKMHGQKSLREIVLEFEAAANAANLTRADFRYGSTTRPQDALRDHYRAARDIVEADIFKFSEGAHQKELQKTLEYAPRGGVHHWVVRAANGRPEVHWVPMDDEYFFYLGPIRDSSDPRP